MHTPSAALAWEFWRRHRTRLMIIIGLVFAFIFVYPKLCAQVGFNPHSEYPMEDFARNTMFQYGNPITLVKVVQILYYLALCCGPAVTMLLTLLCVIWMFTFTEMDHTTKDPMRFPGRLFMLPVSTFFLFWWFLLAGLAVVVALYAIWVYLIPQPQMKIFGMHQNCIGWMTLLVLAQAIVWALASWPGTRMLVLMAVVFGFLGCIDMYNIFEFPLVLPLGAALAYAGLQKMRHGQWQGWDWQRAWAKLTARAELPGPKQFASPAQAQLWFEWRRFARLMCFSTVGLALVPAVILLLARIFGCDPLSVDAVFGFFLILIFMPLLTHFCMGASPARSDQPFLMVRPLANGEIIMPMLKTAAMSSFFSLLAVLAALGALSLLGDFHKVVQDVPLGCRGALVIGWIFVTWRLAVVNLCFVLTGNRHIAGMPALLIVAFVIGQFALNILEQNDVYWHVFLRLVPLLLFCLVAVKFRLAYVLFNASLKRRLISPDAVANYLAVWVVLVVVLLAALIFTCPPREWIFSLSLGVILLVPLARIGLCPLALERQRHT